VRGRLLLEGDRIREVEEQDLTLGGQPYPLRDSTDVDGVEVPIADYMLAGCNLKPAFLNVNGRSQSMAVPGQAE
jgi:hypothetical protein